MSNNKARRHSGAKAGDAVGARPAVFISPNDVLAMVPDDMADEVRAAFDAIPEPPFGEKVLPLYLHPAPARAALVALSASDRACYEYPGETQQPERAAFIAGAVFAAAAPLPQDLSRGERERDVVAEIAAERKRQVEAEGWTPQHDDTHADGAMALAAAAYAYGSQFPDELRKAGGRPHWWPWADTWWKPTTRRRDLVKAGALIVAEIERLDRTLPDTKEPGKRRE